MKIHYFMYLIIPFILSGCNAYISENEMVDSESFNTNETPRLINKNKLSIYSKYKTPEGFVREKPITPFSLFLNNLPLKADKYKVKLYDGTPKINESSYVGIIDLPSFTTNIQHHANAIIRLRAEYFYKNKMYDQINFKVNSRTKVKSYLEFINEDYSYKKFNEYLQYLLEKTTTNSILQNLKSIKMKDIQIGDVLVQRSNIKSHAVIVMDVAKNAKGEKIFILAQSYYPGQDIQIISNPSNEEISPWYYAEDGVILTPEWRFMSSDLMLFID